jgi:RNA polymerase sigma factor (TIGR02999 family)
LGRSAAAEITPITPRPPGEQSYTQPIQSTNPPAGGPGVPDEPSITQLLDAVRSGDAAASDEIYRRLYTDLKRLARAQLSRERRETPTLDTTALVHEAYLRLVPVRGLAVEDSRHFLNLAAKVMRALVIDGLRRRQAAKRGVELLTTWPEGSEPGDDQPLSAEDLLALDQALEGLEGESPRLARLVELRFFAGLELSEIAALLELSERTLKRDWRRAKAFLWSELKR